MTATHTDEDLLESFELTTFEVPVQLELTHFNSFEELELAVVETAAKTISHEADSVDADDVSYITTQVDYNEAEARGAFESDDIEYAVVVTETELGLVD
jgi:hypothetical protein